MQVVWFKRDLRVLGHEPLKQAVQAVHADPSAGPLLCLFVHEPSWEQAPDTSAQHIHFVRESLQSLRQSLSEVGLVLMERAGEATAVFSELHQCLAISRLWSYQETTGELGFERDKAVARWAGSCGVPWTQCPQNAVIRGKQFERTAFNFTEHLHSCLTQAPTGPARGAPCASAAAHVLGSFEADLSHIIGADKSQRLKGGRAAAQALLESFFQDEKLKAYPGAISSPRTAWDGCSRLSPYLSYGVVSDHEVLHALQQVMERNEERDTPDPDLRAAAQFFIERMYWRSAYLQNFERCVSSEVQDDLPSFRGAREGELLQEWLQAWKTGNTGYPMVDAGMRMLAQTGWLNMRLRGTVASFAVNELWLPWREVGLHLAREFLDYEPAIHWNQLQIHAGCSRLSGPLHYNVTKQARDHDPGGQFIRQWVPELRDVPLAYLHEPWTAPASQRPSMYPTPRVALLAAHEAAKERVLALREGRVPPARTYWKQRDALVAAQRQPGLF